ncbi:discoidin domain-containing protein [Sinomicrobium soli]|uniref:discoidin domain-containing protein n=1 Tax=Sinomicrobium sp. N-1-3-6 TaxID=2219864 RepID=UPI000DCB485B|nr:DUF1735 domain-containing protein [Sinomicrobium sp. N-1-3-6]RAV31012.1 hypothetical protein DN748_01835 [Sinomicrobium sp. N-1-3-6]
MKTSTLFRIFLTGLFGVSVLSCSEKELEVDHAEAYSTVFLRAAMEQPYSHTFTIKDEWYPIALGAGYGGVVFQPENISVSLEVRPELVAQYNEENGTSYAPMAADSYRLSEEQVTIPAGKSGSNSIQLEVNPLKFSSLRPHLLPLSIKSVAPEITIDEGLQTVYVLVTGRYEENPFEKLPQDAWTLLEVSSDENDGPDTGGRGYHAFDGSLETFWHSQWRRDEDGNRPGHPHHISIDMGQPETLHGLEIFGRTNQVGGNGNPRDVFVEVSDDGENWQEMEQYALENTASNTLYFPEVVTVRYFRLTVLASHQDVYRTHIAEIEAF